MANKVKAIQEELNRVILKLPRSAVRDLLDKVREESFRRGVIVYDDKGEPRPVDIRIRPWIATKEQRSFFHKVSFAMKEGLHRVGDIYYNEPQARRILTLTPREEEWFFYIYGKGAPKFQTVFDRTDANAVFSISDWRESFKFIEINAVGVGCVHYIPAATNIMEDIIIPFFKGRIGRIGLSKQDDIRQLLFETITAHSRKISRPRANIVLAEDQCSLDGSDEHAFVASYLRERGLTAFAADPRDLYLNGGEIYFRDTPIDIIYRDCSIDELQEMEREGADMDVFRQAFRNNQVVSSIAGEFDHKSTLEIFTDDRYAVYFTPTQRRLFRKYVSWTRLIWDRRTSGPDGEPIELIKFIEKNKDLLVIKPNRMCGGEGVVIGKFAKAAQWKKAIEVAVSLDEGRGGPSHVVQEYVEIREEHFPVLKSNGTVTIEKSYEISGFASSDSGVAFLGRFSDEPIVNISRRGGLIPVVIVA